MKTWNAREADDRRMIEQEAKLLTLTRLVNWAQPQIDELKRILGEGGVTPTKGRKPRTGDQLLRVQWANGDVSKHTYVAAALRWTVTGHPFDIQAVEIVQ